MSLWLVEYSHRMGETRSDDIRRDTVIYHIHTPSPGGGRVNVVYVKSIITTGSARYRARDILHEGFFKKKSYLLHMSNHTDVKNARRFHKTSSASSKFHSKSYTENTVTRLFIYGKIQLIRTVGTIRILNVFNLSGQASWLNTFNKTIPVGPIYLQRLIHK